MAASLDLTHVLCGILFTLRLPVLSPVLDDDSSLFSLFLALTTLSPILLMAAYAALAVYTREFIIIVMWAGQFACEGLNWVIKRLVKQDRPIDYIGNGYGFPSSHSQYMGYFASFLICHLFFRHEFGSTGYRLLDFAWRAAMYSAISAWAGLVAYSRYNLGYHNSYQIFWGFGIGVALGVSLYVVCEYLPRHRPRSIFGKTKVLLLENPISTWLQVRDGWDVWADGGRGEEWVRWRAEWARQQATARKTN